MGDVTLRFIGSGDAFGSGGRFQTCIHLRSETSELLIDCGASSLVAMKQQGIDPGAIDAVLVTHLHGDHFGGLPFLILDAQFSRRERPLLIAGPPGVGERTRAAMEVLFPGSSETRQRFPLDFLELVEGTPTTVAGATVTPFAVTHASGAPALALRVALAGRAIAYSGDTEWTDALVRVAHGVDLLICEAYFYDKAVKFHLDYATLMRHRASLNCRRLILTHMSAEMLARLPLVDCETAEDGMLLSL